MMGIIISAVLWYPCSSGILAAGSLEYFRHFVVVVGYTIPKNAP
jgi:hypothetical protein